MTFYSKAGSFTERSSTGSQAITGVGFQPKAIIFFGMGAGYGWSAAFTQELGVAASSSQYFAASGSSVTNTATTNTHRQTIDAAFSAEYGGYQYGKFTLTSFDSDGFTFNWTTAGSSNNRVEYLAVGGSDITNAAAVQFVTPTGAGTCAVTTPGFKPDLVLFIGDASGATSGIEEHYAHNFGAMDAAGHQWAQYQYSQHVHNPSITGTVQTTTGCIIGTGIGTSVEYKAAFTSMDTNGFTINFGTNNGARRFVALCIKGGGYQVGSWNKSTTTSPAVDTVTTTGIYPTGVFLVTGSTVANDAVRASGLRLSYGASDGISHGSCGGTDKDNVSPTVNYQYNSTTAAINVHNNDTGTTNASGVVAALGTGAISPSLSAPALKQGICTDGTYFYGATMTGLYKYNSSWSVVTSNASAATQAGASLTHLGGIDYYNGQIYVSAVADGTSGGYKNQRIVIYDASTLDYVTYVNCATQFGGDGGTDASGVAVDTDNGLLWVSSFYTGGVIYKYNLYTGAYISSITPSPATVAIQGISYYNGYLYAAYCNNTASDLTGGVTKMNLSGTGQSVAVPHIGIDQATTNVEIEDVCVTSSAIYLLLYDWAGAGKGNVLTFGTVGEGFTTYWNTNNAVAAQICYVAFGRVGIVGGVTATDVSCTAGVPNVGVGIIAPTPTDESFTAVAPKVSVVVIAPTPSDESFTAVVPLIGVKVLAPTPADESFTANVPNVIVDVIVAGVAATSESFTAVSPLAGVGILGVTPTATSCTANIPTVNVSTASPTATTESFTANTPLVSVVVPSVTASTVICSANVPSVVIDAVVAGVTASAVTCTAHVPDLVIDIVVTGIVATAESFTANTALVDTGTYGVTATESFTAVVPDVLIGVNVEGVTATATFTAVVPAIGNDVNVIAVTALATFTAEVPVVSIDAVIIGATANATLTANVPTVIYDVLIAAVTAETNFTSHPGTISVGTFGATAIASFTMGIAGVENVTTYAFEYDALVTYEDYIVHASEIDAPESVLNAGEQMPLVAYDDVGDTIASLVGDEIALAISDEWNASEALYNEDATLSPDESYNAGMIAHEPPTLRPAPIVETIVLLTDEDAETV